MRGNLLLKRMDRYVGIPLVAILSLLRLRQRKAPEHVERIGVLKEAAIGDTVILAAALHDLRALYPRAQIILFVGASNAAFARLLSTPDEVIQIPIGNPLRAIELLRQKKLDLLYDFGQWPRINSLLSYCSGARYTIGFKTPGQFRHFVYDRSVAHRRDRHELENFRHLVGSAPDAPDFDIKIRPYNLPTQKPYVVFHLWPGGERSELKEWPQDRWLQLAKEMHQRGFSVVLTGSPADLAKNQTLAKQLPEVEVHQCAGLAMEDVPALLKNSRLVVSVNTGLMHLAAVLGVPTVGLHGPTAALRWGPRGSYTIAVVSSAPHSQYLHLGFEYPQTCNAMDAISVTDVSQAVEQVLSSMLT